MQGLISDSPRGENGFGWDTIFIKEGMLQTRAELSETEEKATSMRTLPLQELAGFLHKVEL